MDPPWIDSVVIGRETPDDVVTEHGDGQSTGDAPQDDVQAADGQVTPMAPQRRFGSARRAIGSFARGGDANLLARGIGHYSRTGMGGARQLARRMRASTRGGASLVSFLQQVRDGTTTEARRWADDLLASSPSADIVVDAIVKAVMPEGGSADEESVRDSMALALSDLVAMNPSCDLLQMSADDTWTLMQLYLSQEVCNRLRFDMGQFFESARLNPAVAVQRELEMRQFIRNEIGVQLARLRAVIPNPSPRQLDGLMQDALRLTFEVYEGVL